MHVTQLAVWVCYEERPDNLSHADEKMIERCLVRASLTHRSRFPKEVTKPSLAAERVT